MCENGHSSLRHHSPDRETTQMSRSRRTDRYIVLRSYDGILCTNEKDHTTATQTTQMTAQAIRKAQEANLHDSIYIRFRNREKQLVMEARGTSAQDGERY